MNVVQDTAIEHVTFEEELSRSGKVVYTNVGVSMMPLLREGRDIMVIHKADTSKLRKYLDVLALKVVVLMCFTGF